MNQIILFSIYIALILALGFVYERNCRLRKTLVSERKTHGFAMKRIRQLSDAVEGYKVQETEIRSIIRFQEGVIHEFAPQHSDDRPVVNFPLEFPAMNRTEENIKLGNSTII